MEIDIGDIVKMKKKHPCGSDLFEVTRTGMDFKLKCSVCGREIIISRTKLEKSVKSLTER